MILVALGANLPDADGLKPLASCQAAAAALAGATGLRLVALSAWYATAPVPASDQPDYINGVAALDGATTPEALLAALAGLEARAGRVRGAANAARVLDLDIIDLDGMVRDGPDPILPHPRAHQRAFVLRPLRDVAPAWVHPRFGTGIEALLTSVGDQAIRRLPVADRLGR